MKTVNDVPEWLRNLVISARGNYNVIKEAFVPWYPEARADFETAARIISGEPNDSSAPDWANWKAQDQDGKHVFFQNRPYHWDDGKWHFVGGLCMYASMEPGRVLGDWRDTLKPITRENEDMTPEQTKTVEQSMGPPKGATHEYGGVYYLQRGDGQYLRYMPEYDAWQTAVDVNASTYLEKKLVPISGGENSLPYPVGSIVEFDSSQYVDSGYIADYWIDGDKLEVISYKNGVHFPLIILWNTRTRTVDSLIYGVVRPMRSERERWVDQAKQVFDEVSGEFTPTNNAALDLLFSRVYDALASGNLPTPGEQP